MKLISVCVFLVLIPNILSMSREFIICSYQYSNYNYNYQYSIEIVYVCSENPQEIHFTNNKTDTVHCSNSNENMSKSRVQKIRFENCEMPKIKYDYFDIFPIIIELNVSYTGMEQLLKESFNNAAQLQKFNASHNNIAEIPPLLFLNAESLKEVDFSYNKIKQLGQFALSGVKQLTKLDFSFNDFENIRGDYFDNALNLQYLNLSHNKINAVAPNSFAVLKSLNTLNLSFNSMKKLNKSMFVGLTRLQNLELRRLNNETIEIEPMTFDGLDDLKRLNLSNNHISKLQMGTFDGLDRLNFIFLSPVKIDRIEQFAFDGLSRYIIKELDLSNDPLNDELSNKGVTVLDKEAFDNLTGLQHLNLANIPIGTLNVGTFSKLSNLQYLNLSNNELREIKLGTFSHTKDLRVLDLSKNLFKTFDFGHFLPKYLALSSLYLNDNRLTELEGFSPLSFPSLHLLSLGGNHFSCTYLKRFLSRIIVIQSVNQIKFQSDNHIFNPHETNIYGINCKPVDDHTEDSIPSIPTVTSTTSMTIASTITTAKSNIDEHVKFISRDNFTILDTKQLTSSLTEAFSVFSQEQTDLHAIKILLIFMCVVVSILSILFFVILIVNREKLLGVHRYRGFFTQKQQSTMCINNDFEVSTFNRENSTE